ncbi:3,4-dihydroxy-2-butanone-4-phosphate synthase [Oryzobacter terrae]|uniref:3,4-dihydroxy-2-butanone-4-phosphate synthase n=1 Tax=Oryzobacter terrae TaxID=1620385 RepID=UPI00367009F6
MNDTTRLATVEEALDALREGRPVLVVDDEDRENEGDVVLAAETLTERWTAWAVRHSSGYLCAPVTEEVADRLGLPLMVPENHDPLRTAYTVTVDAAVGVTTGISAADRTLTARVLADPTATAADLRRPGHVVPLRARAGGVITRPGHTEAAVDLCRLAGLAPVGLIGELVEDDGSMTRLPGVLALGAREGLPVLTIAALVAWRQRHDRVRRVADTVVPTRHGEFRALGYLDSVTGDEHLALVSPLGVPGSAPLVRVHSECLTGDVFGSQRCDCGPQLERSLERVAAEGGLVLYLRGQEGRGVGLAGKLRAYALQDRGFDTVDAQTELGLPVDAREYVAAAGILADLDVDGIRLLTNNPAKVEGLRSFGVEVVAVERLRTAPLSTNAGYLRTKRDRLGHDLVLDPVDTGTTA